MIHRDLEPRNNLPNQAMEAKVTDFGISKERLDQRMTAGVGTLFWMVPEVMWGGGSTTIRSTFFVWSGAVGAGCAHVPVRTDDEAAKWEPSARPSPAEALYRLQVLIAQDLA